MAKKPANAICVLCGKFMSYDDMAHAVVSVPYGGVQSLEPPDEEYIHVRCWHFAPKEDRALIRRVSWQLCEPIPGTLPVRDERQA